VGSGVIVRSDGLIVTAAHLVKDARRVRVQPRNGETFDRAEVVATDERRNIAVMRIPAAGLSPLLGYAVEEGLVGSRVMLISMTRGGNAEFGSGILNSVALADEIPGQAEVIAAEIPAPASAFSAGSLYSTRGSGYWNRRPLPQAPARVTPCRW
jgi:serine protease Do